MQVVPVASSEARDTRAASICLQIALRVPSLRRSCQLAEPGRAWGGIRNFPSRLHQMDCLTLAGAVLGVSSDAEHRFSKAKKDRITLVEGHGVEGDAHAGEYTKHRFLARRWSWLPNR